MFYLSWKCYKAKISVLPKSLIHKDKLESLTYQDNTKVSYLGITKMFDLSEYYFLKN